MDAAQMNAWTPDSWHRLWCASRPCLLPILGIPTRSCRSSATTRIGNTSGHCGQCRHGPMQNEFFPLLVQVVRMLVSPTINLSAVNATRHSVAPLVIAHGEASFAWRHIKRGY
jgi:hypothetical protein